MIIYIAAWYKRRLEMATVKQELQSMGHVVTSRWIDGLHEHVARSICAQHDIEDITKADTILLFTEYPDIGYYTGGKHVELGIAIALKKRILVVGPRENVFYNLKEIEVFNSWRDACR